MNRYRILALLLFFSPLSTTSYACSCSNSIPVQHNLECYRERMVFRAKVIQIIGKPYEEAGKKYTVLVLAKVTQKYWGFPWYWPKVVLINGGFFCNMALAQGDEYLVSGRRPGYGEVDVSVCSRTKPIADAQVDLRTLDGSNCSGPGGTLIGKLYAYDSKTIAEIPRPNETVSLSDAEGHSFTATSDRDGSSNFIICLRTRIALTPSSLKTPI